MVRVGGDYVVLRIVNIVGDLLALMQLLWPQFVEAAITAVIFIRMPVCALHRFLAVLLFLFWILLFRIVTQLRFEDHGMVNLFFPTMKLGANTL